MSGMADNTTLPPGSGGDIIATDELITINGAAAPAGLKVQRVKVGYGTDGTLVDVSESAPLPVAVPGVASADRQDIAAALLTSINALIAALSKTDGAASGAGDQGIVLFGRRRNADALSADADGDYEPLSIDAYDRLKVAAQSAVYPLVSGDITAAGQSVVMDVGHVSNIVVQMIANTLVGHAAVVEGSLDSTTGSDGNWITLQMVRTNANTVETATGTLAATPAYGWRVSVNGIGWVRVRATAHTTGTATYKVQAAAYATDPAPGVASHAVTLAMPTTGSYNSAATTNATSVKTTSGNVHSIWAFNSGAAAAYLKLFNKTSAPTVGTDIPVMTFLIPAGNNIIVSGGTLSDRYTSGIAFAITGGAADTDTTAVAASQVKVRISFV